MTPVIPEELREHIDFKNDDVILVHEVDEHVKKVFDDFRAYLRKQKDEAFQMP